MVYNLLFSLIYSYLHGLLKKSKMLDMVGFIDPSSIGAVGCGNPTERSRSIADRLTNSKRGQIFLLPYNSGYILLIFYRWFLTYMCSLYIVI